EPKVGRHGLLEARPGSAAVLASRGSRQGGHADVVAAAPVPCDFAEGEKAGVAPVRRDADAVDSGAAHDRDAPTALGAGAKDCERIVADGRSQRPAAPLDRLAELVLL